METKIEKITTTTITLKLSLDEVHDIINAIQTLEERAKSNQIEAGVQSGLFPLGRCLRELIPKYKPHQN